MTREAVLEGFEQFITDAIEVSISNFSVTRALQHGVHGPGSSMVDSLLKNSRRLQRNVIEPELHAYRDRTYEQFHAILEYAESGEDIEAYREPILEAGLFENEIREDVEDHRREAALQSLLDRHHQLGDAIKPLIASPETSFWAACQREMTTEEAYELVEDHFAFTDPILEHREVFRLTTDVNTTDVLGGFGLFLGGMNITVEYTDEALRSLCEAEQAVIETAQEEIDERFDE